MKLSAADRRLLDALQIDATRNQIEAGGSRRNVANLLLASNSRLRKSRPY